MAKKKKTETGQSLVKIKFDVDVADIANVSCILEELADNIRELNKLGISVSGRVCGLEIDLNEPQP